MKMNIFGYFLSLFTKKKRPAKLVRPKHALPDGTLLASKYKITKFLGEGGFGFIYLAEDSAGREVAVKECFPGNICHRVGKNVSIRSHSFEEEFALVKDLFEREATLLKSFAHQNIVAGLGHFNAHNTTYIVQEYVEGVTLSEYLQGKSFGRSSKSFLSLFEGITTAVHYLHERGYVHRDISPDNIIITPSGRAVLIDFGNCISLKDASRSREEDLLVIKEGYSPEELYHKGQAADVRSDIYQLGATVYHCLSGERPPESIQRLIVAAQGQPDPIRRLTGRYPDFPETFLRNTDKSLRLLKHQRLESASQWLQ